MEPCSWREKEKPLPGYRPRARAAAEREQYHPLPLGGAGELVGPAPSADILKGCIRELGGDTWEDRLKFLTKLNILFLRDPATVLLGIYPKELKCRKSKGVINTTLSTRMDEWWYLCPVLHPPFPAFCRTQGNCDLGRGSGLYLPFMPVSALHHSQEEQSQASPPPPQSPDSRARGWFTLRMCCQLGIS